MVSLKTLFSLLRVKHWIKNGFVLVPLIFSFTFTQVDSVLNAAIATIAFCFAASSIYIFNDIQDRENDKKHPSKKNRPIASGKVKITHAYFLSFFLLLLAIGSSFFLGLNNLLIVSAYIVLNILYSLFLKHVSIVDVIIIALGFILRIYQGGVAIDVQLSSWLILTTFFLSLFMGFAKRKSELVRHSKSTRAVLKNYNEVFLNQAITITLTTTIMTFSLYLLNNARDYQAKFLFNLPFFIFACFRYLYLTTDKEVNSDPTELVLNDKGLLLAAALWFLVMVVTYFL